MVNILLIGCLYCTSKTGPPPHHIFVLLTIRMRIRSTFCPLMNGSLRLFLHTENHKESTRYQFTMPNQFHVCELLEQYAISIQFSARIKRKRVFALAVLVLLTLNYTSECLVQIGGRSSPPQRRSSSKNI